jgi:ATP-binding cassette subfamily B protein
VLEAIRIAVPSTTLLVISHRLSTVRHASTIVVISDGAVFEQGSHEQLSVRQGLYQQYVARQALG